MSYLNEQLITYLGNKRSLLPMIENGLKEIEKDVQKITDKYIKYIADAVPKKEKEIAKLTEEKEKVLAEIAKLKEDERFSKLKEVVEESINNFNDTKFDNLF